MHWACIPPLWPQSTRTPQRPSRLVCNLRRVFLDLTTLLHVFQHLSCRRRHHCCRHRHRAHNWRSVVQNQSCEFQQYALITQILDINTKIIAPLHNFQTSEIENLKVLYDSDHCDIMMTHICCRSSGSSLRRPHSSTTPCWIRCSQCITSRHISPITSQALATSVKKKEDEAVDSVRDLIAFSQW